MALTQRYRCVVIPPFDSDGNLPLGIHQATWEEFAATFDTSPYRKPLVDGLYRAAVVFKAAGCSTMYVDGSFVTTKEKPGDYDVCWEPTGVDPSLLDPVFLDFGNKRMSQKLKYGGEFFPSTARAEAAPPYRTFLDFFQVDKNTGKRKGIIALDLRRLP